MNPCCVILEKDAPSSHSPLPHLFKAGKHSFSLNSFWFLHIFKTFLEDIKEYYQANVESLDFEHAAEESEKKINSWVESQTNGTV